MLQYLNAHLYKALTKFMLQLANFNICLKIFLGSYLFPPIKHISNIYAGFVGSLVLDVLVQGCQTCPETAGEGAGFGIRQETHLF